MKGVTVKKEELLTKLRENREGHRAISLEAQAGYKTAVIEELEKRLADARDGKRVQVHVRMDAPDDHTEEYDRSIAMLEMSVDDEIEVTAHEFACFVMDDWGWKQDFLLSNSAYSGTAMTMLAS